MKTPSIRTSSGGMRTVETFDPFVAQHFANLASYTDALLHQINVEEIYAPMFSGRRDLTFLDIGANIGLVSLYAEPACKRIVAVEPAPDTFRVLQAMIMPFPKIEPVCAALAPVDGQVSFFVNDLNSTASSTVNTYGSQTTVPGLRLSSVLRIYQLEVVDVLKCDAEGSEGESLSFEELHNAAPIVREWYIECHNCPKSTWEQKLGRIVQDLSRLGYYKQRIDGMTLHAKR